MATWYKSFIYALRGIKHGWRTQKNLRIHGFMAVIVIALGLILKLSRWEWVGLSFAIALVLTAEMLNTAVECVVDLYTREFHPLAETAKNVAAGAVIITALNAVAVGSLILGPAVWSWLQTLLP